MRRRCLFTSTYNPVKWFKVLSSYWGAWEIFSHGEHTAAVLLYLLVVYETLQRCSCFYFRHSCHSPSCLYVSQCVWKALSLNILMRSIQHKHIQDTFWSRCPPSMLLNQTSAYSEGLDFLNMAARPQLFVSLYSGFVSLRSHFPCRFVVFCVSLEVLCLFVDLLCLSEVALRRFLDHLCLLVEVLRLFVFVLCLYSFFIYLYKIWNIFYCYLYLGDILQVKPGCLRDQGAPWAG